MASLVSHTQGEKITYLPRNKCAKHGYISVYSHGKCFNLGGFKCGFTCITHPG